MGGGWAVSFAATKNIFVGTKAASRFVAICSSYTRFHGLKAAFSFPRFFVVVFLLLLFFQLKIFMAAKTQGCSLIAVKSFQWLHHLRLKSITVS